jgi:hypothetical protein
MTESRPGEILTLGASDPGAGSPPIVSLRFPASSGCAPERNERDAPWPGPEWPLSRPWREARMYQILFVIGAIVMVVVVLRVLRLF